MAQSVIAENFLDEIRKLVKRVERLERSQPVPPQYTTALRPAAADEPGIIIFNITTSKHQGSNGTTWNDLF